MGLQIAKSTDTKYNPVFRKILEDIPGGVTLKVSVLPSDKYEVLEGALIAPSATTGLHEVVKNAKLAVNHVSNEANLKINVNNYIAVGDFLTNGTVTGCKVTAITRGTTYDTLTLATAYVATLATNTFVFEALSSIVTTKKHTASALLAQTVQFRDVTGTALQNITAGAVTRGTVNESLMPMFATTTDKTNLTARILFV
jgi:hypothetical protein